jgi:hypothetical protein
VLPAVPEAVGQEVGATARDEPSSGGERDGRHDLDQAVGAASEKADLGHPASAAAGLADQVDDDVEGCGELAMHSLAA